MCSNKRRGLGDVEIAKPKVDLQIPSKKVEGDQFDLLRSDVMLALQNGQSKDESLSGVQQVEELTSGKPSSPLSPPRTTKTKSPRKRKKQKSPPMSQRRSGVNKKGVRFRRLEFEIVGKDVERFEDLMAISKKIMGKERRVKNVDIFRSILPTYLKIIKYVDKEKLLGRPKYGSKNYRDFIEAFADAIWEAAIDGIAAEIAQSSKSAYPSFD